MLYPLNLHQIYKRVHNEVVKVQPCTVKSLQYWAAHSLSVCDTRISPPHDCKCSASPRIYFRFLGHYYSRLFEARQIGISELGI